MAATLSKMVATFFSKWHYITLHIIIQFKSSWCLVICFQVWWNLLCYPRSSLVCCYSSFTHFIHNPDDAGLANHKFESVIFLMEGFCICFNFFKGIVQHSGLWPMYWSTFTNTTQSILDGKVSEDLNLHMKLSSTSSGQCSSRGWLNMAMNMVWQLRSSSKVWVRSLGRQQRWP